MDMKIGKYDTQDVMKAASTAFAVYTVIKTVHDARRDSDGLQLAEALLRGATLTLSIIIIIRNLSRDEEEQALEAAEGQPA